MELVDVMSSEPCINCNEIFVIPKRPDIADGDFNLFEKFRWKAYQDGVCICFDCFFALYMDMAKEIRS